MTTNKSGAKEDDLTDRSVDLGDHLSCCEGETSASDSAVASPCQKDF